MENSLCLIVAVVRQNHARQRVCFDGAAEQLRPVALRLGEVPFPVNLDAGQRAELAALQLPLPSARLKLDADDPRADVVQSVLAEEGLGCDVASGGELYLALRAGFDPKRIYLHGNAKSETELRQAVEAGIANNTRIEIMTGVQPGELVALNSLNAATPLRPGLEVRAR